MNIFIHATGRIARTCRVANSELPLLIRTSVEEKGRSQVEPKKSKMPSPIGQSHFSVDDLAHFDPDVGKDVVRVRLASFNVENLDLDDQFEDRVAVLRPQLYRLRADVLCLQEVHSQGGRLTALKLLLQGTPYETYNVVTSTRAGSGVGARPKPMEHRNLVILSRFPVLACFQLKNEKMPKPLYRRMTSEPRDNDAQEINWERPCIYVLLNVHGSRLHVVNCHLKSQHPTNIPGQSIGGHGGPARWKTPSGWAEGSFVSAMKRLGQAVEARLLVDEIFDQDPEAWVAVCGDFNEAADSVPVQAMCGEEALKSNADLGGRVLVHCSQSVAKERRYTLYHHGHPHLFDHILISRSLLTYFRGEDIHNEFLRDKSVRYPCGDVRFPESDHAPVVVTFVLPTTLPVAADGDGPISPPVKERVETSPVDEGRPSQEETVFLAL